MVTVSVVVYSGMGHTQKMAEAVAQGAREVEELAKKLRN